LFRNKLGHYNKYKQIPFTAFGIEDGCIGDKQITASSSYGKDMSAYNARLNKVTANDVFHELYERIIPIHHNSVQHFIVYQTLAQIPHKNLFFQVLD